MNNSNEMIGVIVAVAVALGTAGAVMMDRTAGLPAADRSFRSARQLAAAMPPLPPPLAFADMTPDQARQFNATVPFAAGKTSSVGIFRYQGSAVDRAVAQACLTAAVLYEAGDDRIGEQAVAQVVVNRLRHAAFPKTICGVIFEGSERKTGC